MMCARAQRIVVGGLAAMALVGCTRPEDRAVDDPSPDTLPVATSTTVTTTEPATTTSPSTATTPSTTPPAPTSTTDSTVPASTQPPTPASSTSPPTTAGVVESPDDLTLVADGILPLRFGGRDSDVVAALSELFGDPVSDRSVRYPVADDGLFVTEDGEQAFIAPFGRTVCWADALCTEFGAGAPESLIFTGWSLGPEAEGSPTEPLATERGIAIGSVLADVAELVTYDPAQACLQVAYGFAAGVEVDLLSADGVFAAPNSDGDGVDVREPDPSQVTVTRLSAGERPFSLFEDC